MAAVTWIVREAVAADVEVITALFNAQLTTTTTEYTEVPHTVDGRRQWLGSRAASGFPVLVAESADRVIGVASYGDFRDSVARPGYRFTVEHTVHVDETWWGTGVGRSLVEALIDRARTQGKHVMIGAIDAENIGSIRFHEQLGFIEVGRLPEVGYKFGRRLDLVFLQLRLDDTIPYSRAVLELTPDRLLTTTRAVRKRLDLERDVPDDLIRECVAAAMQAPSGSNNMTMQFVVVRDQATRHAIGEVYRQCYEIYRTLDGFYVGSITKETEVEQAQQRRVQSSADYLGDHMGEVPALVIGCTMGRLDGVPALMSASMMGNIMPAMWSFMLAARARGLGTAWTSMHLMKEQQVAEIVGIPFDEVQQVCLTPLAFTVGTDFRPAVRPAPDAIIHWDSW